LRRGRPGPPRAWARRVPRPHSRRRTHRSRRWPPRRARMTDINRRRGLTFGTLIALIALATLAAALSGCAVGPNYAKPATPVAPQFVEGAAGAPPSPGAPAQVWAPLDAAPRQH